MSEPAGVPRVLDLVIASSVSLREAFLEKVESKEVDPIALAEKNPDFWIKHRKLDRVVDAQANVVIHELGESQDFLDRLQERTLR